MPLNASTPPSDDAGHAPPSSVAVIALLQQQLEEAQRLAGIGSWSWDLDSGSVTWSRETYRILGIDPATPPSFESVLALAVDATRQEQFLAMVHAALRGEQEYDFEIPAKLGSGRFITIHTRGSVERAADGTPLRMVGTMQDVTAMRAAEGALRERESHFRTLAESSPTGVFQTDTTGRTVYANQRLLGWFDLTMEAFAKGLWLTRVHPDDLPSLKERTARIHDLHEQFDTQYRIVVNDHIRWLHVRAAPLFDADGVTVVGRIGSVLDTSAERFAAEERTRLQSQLQQARRLESLGLLAGGIAHDFNNLLVGILANASLARDELPLQDTGREALDDIAHAAQRAADLTRQLLAYAGRARVERRQVALPALVAELPKVLGARVPSQVTLSVEASEPLLVDGDETQLRQIVLNLVTNAVDAIGTREGRVELRVASRECTATDLQRCLLGRDRTPGRYAVVTVQDTGAGMSAEVQERMFDPFYTTKRSGRGLGLAATLGALNSHLGAILVESTVGIGTTIHVLLPVSVKQGTPESVPAIPDTSYVGSGTVLLVDDDASARSAARRILSRAGFDVREAENGADAIVQYETLAPPPRCIVLDLSMPIMSGDECLHVLRAQGSTVPVLMSSGYDADDVAGHLVVPGSVHFLQKPYTAGALLKAVGELIGPG